MGWVARRYDKSAFYSEYDGKWHIINEELEQQLGFLFAAYEPGAWWFEILEMIRKVRRI